MGNLLYGFNMKKTENFLLLPVLVLLFYGASKYSAASIDIHFHDTYYIIASAPIAGWFALWLLIVFALFKWIRHRHQVINQKFFATYITLTLLSFGIFLLGGLMSGPSGEGRFSDSELDALIFRDNLRMVAACCFLLFQIIFLIYFIVQLLKRPVIQR